MSKFTIAKILTFMIFRHWKILWAAMRSVSYKKRFIRVSPSAILRLEVDGKYLLIKSTTSNRYKPIGGVFKRHPSGKNYLDSLEYVVEENPFADLSETEDDLRGRLPGSKFVNFLCWFWDGRDRESAAKCAARESLEEFYVANVDADLCDRFKELELVLVREVSEGLKLVTRTNGESYGQFRYVYVFKLVDCDDSRDFTSKLAIEASTNTDSILRLISRKEIENESTDDGIGIASNAAYFYTSKVPSSDRFRKKN